MLVTCAIIAENGKVLVARRPFHKSQGGKWEFPGGKVDGAESPEECICREMMEELNVGVTVSARLITVAHQYPGGEIELMPLVCVISEGSIQLSEHIAFRWASAGELATLDLCESDKKLLPQVLPLL